MQVRNEIKPHLDYFNDMSRPKNETANTPPHKTNLILCSMKKKKEIEKRMKQNETTYISKTKNKYVRTSPSSPAYNEKIKEIVIDTRNKQGPIHSMNTNSYFYHQQKNKMNKYKTYRVKNIQIDNEYEKTNDDYAETSPQSVPYNQPVILNPQFSPYKTASNTLYTILTKKKNEFLNTLTSNSSSPYELYCEPDGNVNTIRKMDIRKCFQMNPPTNYFKSKKIDLIPQKSRGNYDGEIACSYEMTYNSISEKERYQKIMESFLNLRSFIDKEHEKEHLLLKEYLMDHGIYDMQYYEIDRLNNFANFLRSNFKINPQKNFKENIIEALTYNTTTINACTETNESPKKDIRCRTTSNNFQRQRIYRQSSPLDRDNKIDLIHNMELQKGLYDKKSLLKHQIDLINKPKFVIDLLKEEFTDDKKDLPLITNSKVENKKSNDKFGNERLYGVKKSNIDYDVLRKKNKLTEYICLIKAKNNFEMNNLNKNFFKLK